MKNQQAQRLAEQQAAFILDQVHDSKPDRINVAQYASESDFYSILGPVPGFEFQDWQQITRELQIILKRHKIKLNWIPLYAEDYFKWLESAGKNNTSATRAEYSAHVTRTENTDV